MNPTTILAIGLTILPQTAIPQPTFSDVAPEVGVTALNVNGDADKDYIIETNGNGAAFFDYDNDGDMDLLLANGSTMDRIPEGGDPMATLYRNDGGQFVDVTAAAGMNRTGWGVGVCVADYDNDGNRDVYLTAYGPNVLYRNNGDGTFQDGSAPSGTGDAHWSTNCAFADYDRDGYVDLYVANYLTFDDSVPGRDDGNCKFMGTDVMCGPMGLTGEPDTLYRNNGDGTFSDVTSDAGITDPDYFGFGVAFTDFDDDGWPDIYIANDSVPNLMFQNNRDGTFTEVGLLSGTALNELGRQQAGMGVAVGDYDGNGLPDIFVTNFSHDTNTLYQNLGGMLFLDNTARSGMRETSLPYLGWGAAFADLNNDGWEDLFVANGHVYPEIDQVEVGTNFLQPKEIYLNQGNSRFIEVGKQIGGDVTRGWSARGLAVGDYDNDGDIDAVAVNMDERPSLYRNESGNGQHWLGIRLEGTRSNRDAIGARIQVEAGGRIQTRTVSSGSSYLSNHDVRAHFGLGQTDTIDRLTIRWPDGTVEDVTGVGVVDRYVTIREGDGAVR